MAGKTYTYLYDPTEVRIYLVDADRFNDHNVDELPFAVNSITLQHGYEDGEVDVITRGAAITRTGRRGTTTRSRTWSLSDFHVAHPFHSITPRVVKGAEALLELRALRNRLAEGLRELDAYLQDA